MQRKELPSIWQFLSETTLEIVKLQVFENLFCTPPTYPVAYIISNLTPCGICTFRTIQIQGISDPRNILERKIHLRKLLFWLQFFYCPTHPVEYTVSGFRHNFQMPSIP